MPGWKSVIILGIVTVTLLTSGCYTLQKYTDIGAYSDPGSSALPGSKLNPAPVGEMITYYPTTGNKYYRYDTNFLGCTLCLTLPNCH
ncbi:hypothetical protein [Methanocella arvoryzae]|uniref:Lipoprotein n=1 Tax=Methanocella arvoryzae (strain DSM 22066 / NBRC 105507 / MRE50) TaxID=351160 RepID=Q0W526_METAR|nr:hypothetical protein [Methanocella arvoryzae]CAJ36517.1 hypothetical protein RCIX1213 [Methanocella arvoryzae MRE50]